MARFALGSMVGWCNPQPPPVIYSHDYGRSGSHRHLHDRQSESRRTRHPVRHLEPPSPPEANRALVPLPSALDNLLHYSPPLLPRRSADSASSYGINPQGSVREQSRQLERPESPGSYPARGSQTRTLVTPLVARVMLNSSKNPTHPETRSIRLLPLIPFRPLFHTPGLLIIIVMGGLVATRLGVISKMLGTSTLSLVVDLEDMILIMNRCLLLLHQPLPP